MTEAGLPTASGNVAAANTADTPGAPSGRILVVDDEPEILMLMTRLLRRAGHAVDTAEDGLIALGRLDQAIEAGVGYALVVSDLKMPGADGLRVLREVKERSPDTMFVLVTGFATLDSAVSALREGVYDYLTKPIDIEHLLSTVKRALEHRTLLLQNEQLIVSLRETAAALRQRSLSLERLHRQEQRKTEQLRRVNAIARQITTILDVETLVKTVVDLLGPTFGFESPSFGLIDGDSIHFRGGTLDGRRELARDGLFWRLTEGGRKPFLHGAPPVRSDASPASGDDLPEQPAMQEAEPVPYDLVFPLQAGDQPVGFWVARWKKGSGSHQENLPYLESLAAQTVAVLENARLYALARRADELAFLNTVSRVANRSLDPRETIEGVLACIQRGFSASLVEICLLNDRREIESAFSLVRPDAPAEMERVSPALFWQDTLEQMPPECTSETILNHPLLSTEFVRRVGGQPSLVSNRQQVQEICSSSLGEHGGPGSADLPPLRSLLAVSLRSGGRHIGVLGAGSFVEGAYDLESGYLLQVVGGQVATAIENARLFQEVESGRRVVLESRNTLQAVFDGILDGIYIVDRDRRILAINRTQAGWAGSDFSDLVGHPAERAFPASRHSPALIDEVLRTGRPLSCDERWRTPEGQWTEWEIHAYPIAGSAESGGRPNVDRVVVVVRDVTEQRWLEASLLQSEKLAAVGTLAAGIAHEINNPMTVVSANAQILSEEIPATHPYYSSVQLIDRASERASKIVRNLLDFSRSEEFEFVPTDLNRSIVEAISLVQTQIRRASIRIVMDLADDLPAISASPDRLHVVWLNLLINARDAVQDMDRQGEIRFSTRRRGDWVVVHISDNGAGIPDEQLGHLYEPFFTTKEPGKGTGLGLFTCYRTVTRHGGEITADSQLGEGTTFRVLLPIRQG